MPSEVDICNLALQRLGAKAITALNDDSVRARECNRVYAHARDTELRAHPWSFARKRAALAASTTAPAFGYTNAFPLPADFLRLLPTREQADLQIESGSILTDDGAPLKVVYLKQVTDPNAFDQTFTDLLVARIARDVCEKVTNSTKKLEIAQTMYLNAKAEARKVNAFERPPQEPPTDTWITARY
jgi:hypothetical protein